MKLGVTRGRTAVGNAANGRTDPQAGGGGASVGFGSGPPPTGPTGGGPLVITYVVPQSGNSASVGFSGNITGNGFFGGNFTINGHAPTGVAGYGVNVIQLEFDPYTPMSGDPWRLTGHIESINETVFVPESGVVSAT